MEMELFAFLSTCLTGPPSFYGVHYKGVRPHQKFGGSHTLSNKQREPTFVLPLKSPPEALNSISLCQVPCVLHNERLAN